MKNSFKILLICLAICFIDIFMVAFIKYSILRMFLLVHLYVCIHEISHMIAYMLQGIKINSITFFFLKIYYEDKLKMKYDLFKGYLGIVIPEIEVHSRAQVEKIINKIKRGIVTAPCVNLFFFVCWVGLAFWYSSAIVVMSIYINLVMLIMSLGKLDYVSGDIIAYVNINKDSRFYYLYIYTFYKQNHNCNKEGIKILIDVFEKIIVLSQNDIYTKKIIYNILDEQLHMEEQCISSIFLDDLLVNIEYFVQGAKDNRYIDYVICLKLVLVLCKYQYVNVANELFDKVKDVFANNELKAECSSKLQLNSNCL